MKRYLIPDGHLYKACIAAKDLGYKKIIINRWSIRAYPIWRGKNAEERIEEDKLPDNNGWPAIWKVNDKLGHQNSCGNSHQSQLSDIKDKPFQSNMTTLDTPEWMEGDSFEKGMIVDLEQNEHEMLVVSGQKLKEKLTLETLIYK